MPDGQVIEFTRVTKRFNDVTAVSDFSARIEPGVVTAFLGPNGAGKTTTLRILLGQVRPSSGTATIGGVAYADLRAPLRTIGAVLEETVYRPRRTASRQLSIAAKANGIPLARVDEVLALVGLDREREGRIGSFSLGMRQRLSVANALLGDPGTLVFDEPANGLDPEGIRWMRLLMRRLADEGRTVIVSSHVLSEVEQVADHVLVLSQGQLVLSSGIEKLADPSSGAVVVDAADRDALRSALGAAGMEFEVLRSGLTVRGTDARTVGAVAASAGVALSTLVQRGPTLEDVFIELVRGGGLEPRAEAAASRLLSEEGDPSGAAAAPEAVPSPHGDETAATPDAAEAAGEQSTADEAPDAPEQPDAEREASADAVPAEAPSFDDILFGTATADGAQGSDADAEQVADADDAAEAEGPDTEGVVASETQSADATDEEHTASPDAAADQEPAEPADDDAPSGIEVFDALSDGDDAEDADENSDASGAGENSDENSDTDEDEQSSDTGEQSSDEGEDPRSAAVSSMLAAAARAYYEDEPRDYPFGAAPARDDNAAHEHTDDDTAVISTVPLSRAADERGPEATEPNVETEPRTETEPGAEPGAETEPSAETDGEAAAAPEGEQHHADRPNAN